MALAGLFTALTLSAQSHKVSLQLQDASNGEPVGFATVSISTEKGQPKYTLTDGEGKAVLEKVRVGKYTLKAEIMGYKPHQQSLEVKADMNLGVIKLDPDTQVLDAAAVTAVGNPIIIKKDTVEYNASSFKISDDNMLVDLLKKLPGIEVSEDGTITSNGETISKITIAGKTFFLDDPQLASQNIPAKLVEKVKVVKKKSEQAEFTGIDDGDEETVIDLTVQRGMMNGVFGNVMAGGGADIPAAGGTFTPRWQGAMGGRFTEDSQISVILNGNNTNNRGFNDLSGSMMGNMMGGGGMMGMGGGGFGGFGRSNGITTSWMGGVNGNFDLMGDKMDLGGNYLYNGSIVDVTQDSYKETYKTDGSTLYSDTDGLSHRFTDGHRFGIRLEHKFSENTSILFQPQINFGRGNYLQQSVFDTWLNDKNNRSNTGFTNNLGDNKNLQTRGFFLFRQRLGMPGRTLSVNLTWNISNNTMDGYNQSLTNTQFDASGLPITDPTIVNQRIDQSSKSRGVGGRLVYTEPLGNNFYLEGSYNINWSQSETIKDVYNLLTNPSLYNGWLPSQGVLSLPTNTTETYDQNYSNNIVNRNLSQNIGAAFMYQNEKLRGQLGASAIPTNTYNYTNGKEYTDKRWNFSPRAMLFYDFTENSNIRLFYFGRSAQPSTSQLNPVLDNSNPLAMSLGNPYLTPYFNHSLRTDLEYSNKQTFFTARLHLEGGMVQNPITSAIWYDENNRQYSFPVNGSNSYSANARLMINAPIAKSNFSISNMANVSYSKSGSYLGAANLDMTDYWNGEYFDYAKFHEYYFEGNSGKWAQDFLANDTRSLSFVERLRATYRDDHIEVIVSGRTRFNKPWYTVQAAVDPTWNNQVSGSFKWTIGETGIELSTDANYNWYRGYTSAPPAQFIWNAKFSIPLFQRQATLSLNAYDILNQAKNLTVSDTNNYHQEVLYNTLGRYVMLSLTWRFGNFGKAREQMRSRMGGGPGGFRGGPPMGGRPF
jgi:hypothetical protein